MPMSENCHVTARVDTELRQEIKQSPYTVKELIKLGLGLEGKDTIQAQRKVYLTQLQICEEELTTLNHKRKHIQEQLAYIDQVELNNKSHYKKEYESALYHARNYLQANKNKRDARGFQPRVKWDTFKEELSDHKIDPEYVYNNLPEVLQNEVEK